MYPEALSTKQCMDFSLGEPERIHDIFLSSEASQKILSISSCILKRSAQNNAWTSAWVNQKGYITFSYQVMRAKKFCRFCYVSWSALQKILYGLQPGWTRKDTIKGKRHSPYFSSYILPNLILFVLNILKRSGTKIMPAWTWTWMNQKGYKKYKLSALRMMLSPRIVFIWSTESSWSGALEADVIASVDDVSLFSPILIEFRASINHLTLKLWQRQTRNQWQPLRSCSFFDQR